MNWKKSLKSPQQVACILASVLLRSSHKTKTIEHKQHSYDCRRSRSVYNSKEKRCIYKVEVPEAVKAETQTKRVTVKEKKTEKANKEEMEEKGGRIQRIERSNSLPGVERNSGIPDYLGRSSKLKDKVEEGKSTGKRKDRSSPDEGEPKKKNMEREKEKVEKENFRAIVKETIIGSDTDNHTQEDLEKRMREEKCLEQEEDRKERSEEEEECKEAKVTVDTTIEEIKAATGKEDTSADTADETIEENIKKSEIDNLLLKELRDEELKKK